MSTAPLEPSAESPQGLPSNISFQQEFIQAKSSWQKFNFINLLNVIIIIGITTLVCSLATWWLHLKPEACCLIFLGSTVLFGAILPPPATFLLALFSLISWNFFFVGEPYSLSIDTADELILHLLFILFAIVMNQLTAGLRQRERESRQSEHKAHLLRACQTALASDNTKDFLDLITQACGGTAQLVLDTDYAPTTTSRTLVSPLVCSTESYGFLKIDFTETIKPTAFGTSLFEEISRLAATHLERQRLLTTKEKAQKAAVSERLGRALLDNVTHEIKTPVAIMLASIHRLRAHSENQHTEDITNISDAAKRLVRITEELTLVSSVKTQMLRARTEYCNAAELAEEIIGQSVPNKIRERLKVIIDSPAACVRTDPQFFGIILTNFLSNAARHSPPESPIHLLIKEQNGKVMFAVTDQGKGVLEVDLPHIFERFYRGENPGSLGLGLSICREIAGVLNAELTVHNRPPLGAEFAVHLTAVPPYLEKDDPSP